MTRRSGWTSFNLFFPSWLSTLFFFVIFMHWSWIISVFSYRITTSTIKGGSLSLFLIFFRFASIQRNTRIVGFYELGWFCVWISSRWLTSILSFLSFFLKQMVLENWINFNIWFSLTFIESGFNLYFTRRPLS